MALKMKKFLSDLVGSPKIRPWQEKLILIIQFSFEKVFCEKGVPRNFTKFTGITRARVSFFLQLY